MTTKKLLLSTTLAFAISLGCGGGGGGGTPTAPPGGSGNRNPTANLNISTTHMTYGGTATVTVAASDIDGDQLTFTWAAQRGSVLSSGPSATSANFTAGNTWGQATVTVTVSDGRGGTAQATAQAYIRNPNPPNFTLGTFGTASCGYGTAIPDGFKVKLTPAEPVLITNIYIQPTNCVLYASCASTRSYGPPISLAAGQEYQWLDGPCPTPQCCQNTGCGNCAEWNLTIQGTRPEPDGGAFLFTRTEWP